MSQFAKSRVDALSDGVYAFAMTLLVLDVRLPDDLAASSAGELTAHLLGLGHQMLTYLISFFVLGAFWRSAIALRPSGEAVGGAVVRLSLLQLLFVTLVPFSSGLVGRYGAFAPAVMVYGANMIVLAGLTIALRHLDVVAERRRLRLAMGRKLPLLILSAVVSMLVSLVHPHAAMYAYFLNLLDRLPLGRDGPQGTDAASDPK